MNVYDLFSEIEFEEFELTVLINLERLTTVKIVKIKQYTRISDIYDSIKDFLSTNKCEISDREYHRFIYVNGNGEEEELSSREWDRRVKDLDIFSYRDRSSLPSNLDEMDVIFNTVKFEADGCFDQNHYKLEKMIGTKEETVSQMVTAAEMNAFEKMTISLIRQVAREYQNLPFEERIIREHPNVILEKSYETSVTNMSNISLNIGLEQTNDINSITGCNKKIMVNRQAPITDVLNIAVSKYQERTIDINKQKTVTKYLLKIADRDEYLVPTNIEIIRFKYISDCIRFHKTPSLVLVPQYLVEDGLTQQYKDFGSTEDIIIRPTENHNSYKTGHLKEDTFYYIHDLWKNSSHMNVSFAFEDSPKDKHDKVHPVSPFLQIDEKNLFYSIKFTELNFPQCCSFDKEKITIVAGLYHGNNSLCENCSQNWSESPGELVFPIAIWNLPRMARLSFALMIEKQKQYIGWGNLMIYDLHSVMRTDFVKYRLWPSNKPHLNPTGSVYSNPHGDLVCPELHIQLAPGLINVKKIVYPDKAMMLIESNELIGDELYLTPSSDEKETIRDVLLRSPMDDVMEDEQEIIWKYRYYIRDTHQDALPRILNARPWNNFVTVVKMEHITCGWPLDKNVVLAMELLGPDFPDSDIRCLAVNCLASIPWHELYLYLLQLCQCLKYESYLNSNLVEMLLKKMAMNSKIAQTFFYFMKVEMNACEWARVPFAIILYKYLRCGPQLRITSLLRQYKATAELCHHNKQLKQLGNNFDGDMKQQCLTNFRKQLSEQSKAIFDDLPCPVDINIRLKTLEVKSCNVMDSKMRPIKLMWRVNQAFNQTFSLIYKNGDDLRQDALIVQVMHIMDSIWEKASIDLRLAPYEVLACSKKEGFIEVVQKADTLANIVKESRSTSAVLYNWLLSKSSTDAETFTANFRRSCAAYCVATFVMGIGDRHNDNIMLTTEGHLFHIDFGHILGNFKKIIGLVSREWTKFILVTEFLWVIGNGKQPSDNSFKELCCEGYLALRNHSNLILSLFKMMISADIPELTSLDNLDYLKHTLKIGSSVEDARAYFNSVYDDTLKKQALISLNWKVHSHRRNNT